MLSIEGIMEIKILAKQGRSLRAIAREMQVARNTFGDTCAMSVQPSEYRHRAVLTSAIRI
jgi:transposase